MKFKDRIRHLNKRTINRLTGRIAHSSRGPFSIVYHVGRRSGKQYQTPIIVIPIPDGFVIALTYGPEVDWYRNIQASGECRILWHRNEYSVETIETMAPQDAIPYFPAMERLVLKLIGIEDFIRLGTTTKAQHD